MAGPNFLLQIIPHVDGTPRICELAEYHLEDIVIKGAWTAPGALSLAPHALAPVEELPVLEVISAQYFVFRRRWRARRTAGRATTQTIQDFRYLPNQSSACCQASLAAASS
jgi:hypothetical protein